jgi:hypothetical protein
VVVVTYDILFSLAHSLSCFSLSLPYCRRNVLVRIISPLLAISCKQLYFKFSIPGKPSRKAVEMYISLEKAKKCIERL